MSVPTHNLYDFVHQVTKKRFWLRYFDPWGSRDLANLVDYQVGTGFLNNTNGIPVENWSVLNKFKIEIPIDHRCLLREVIKCTVPTIICHDQEPLDFSLYNCDSEQVKKINIPFKFPNLSLNINNAFSIQKKSILLHSELNSSELEQYEESDLFVGAYWWSHAAIARDWYRFAEYDKNLSIPNYNKSKLFLTYCRGQTGSRLYRADFLERLHRADLYNNCQITSNHTQNPGSHLSAEYHSEDFYNTAVSIVLETTFDNRIHLTEKILRPIACGHPFLLANGPGSLKLLRNYGFKTFHPVINEDYDLIADSAERLTCIVNEMQRLKSMSESQLSDMLSKCVSITEHNKKWFFSDEFFQLITDELEKNVDIAYSKIDNKYYINQWLDASKRRSNNTLSVDKVIMRKLIQEIKKFQEIKDE